MSLGLRLQVLAAWCLLVACWNSDTYKPKFVVVFVDTSASVKDVSGYRDAWALVQAKLAPGDRVILAPISDETYTRFRPAADVELPQFSWTTDNKLVYEKDLTDARQKLQTAFDALLKQPKTSRTRILDTFVLAGKIFASDNRRHVLLLLSDMLEDSEEYNFEKWPVTTSLITKAIRRPSASHHLPNLSGVEMYVAGASAPSEKQARDIEDFWRAYARACRAPLQSENYGPTLVRFEK